MRLRLTDADSRIFYLDAADKDYDTAAVLTPLLTDDVTTGTGPKAFDSVGAAVAAAQSSPMPVVKNPIEVAIVNGGTAGDVITVDFDYEYGVFGAAQFVLPTAVSTTSTKTVNLQSKFAQVLGFRALSVGTSTTTRLSIIDADSKIVYLDAADKDYDTAELDKIIIIDPTVTGLTGVVPRNNTGAAIQAGIGRIEPPLVRSPLTVTATSQDGNDEVVTAWVYYKRG
jgi:hypothetical protein